MEKVIVYLKWIGDQAYKCFGGCFSDFKDFTEENIPLFYRPKAPRYYGNLTPPNEVDRVDILVEEQPTIISIIDNVRDCEIEEESDKTSIECEDKEDKEDKEEKNEIFYDMDVPVASV